MNEPDADDNKGSVVSVRGSVVDVYFTKCLRRYIPAPREALNKTVWLVSVGYVPQEK